MMLRYKKVVVPAQPAREEERLDAVICDLCGEESHDEDWQKSGYDATESEVRLKEGESFAEGGSGIEVKYDICPDCFKKKLIPWMEANGARTVIKEWDY